MALEQLADAFERRPIQPGNVVSFPYSYRNQMVQIGSLLFGYTVGYAQINATLQSDIILKKSPKWPGSQTDYLDQNLIIPDHAQIISMGIALPPNTPSDSNIDPIPNQLTKNATLIGTTGENLKIGTAHTDTTPVITSASNAYTPGNSVNICRALGEADSAPLTTLAADTTYRLLVSNAGNTAAGNGIRTSEGTALILAGIGWLAAAKPLTHEEFGQITVNQ